MRALILALMLLVAPVLSVAPTWAVQPDEVLSDPALEQRARSLSKGLRCLVCRNESIDESNASLARDLRILLRERLVAGDSDEEAVAYIVDRYGEYVLLTPPARGSTWVRVKKRHTERVPERRAQPWRTQRRPDRHVAAHGPQEQPRGRGRP